MEPQHIDVIDQFQFWGDINIDTAIDQQQTGVHEVGLALNPAGTQVGKQASCICQVGAKQLDRLPLPVAEVSTGKVFVGEGGVESCGMAVVGIAVSRCPEERCAEPRVIAVITGLDGRESGGNILLLVGQGIECIVT